MHQHVSDERYTHSEAKGGPKRSRVRPERSIAIKVPPHDHPASYPLTLHADHPLSITSVNQPAVYPMRTATVGHWSIMAGPSHPMSGTAP